MDNKSEAIPSDYERRDVFDTLRSDGLNPQVMEQQVPNGNRLDSRGIGNKALNMPGENQNVDEQVRVSNEHANAVNYPSTASVEPEPTIKTTDRLNSEAVEAIDEAMSQLSKDGDAASFYDKGREYMEKNIGNSFGRKLGDGYK